MGTLAVLAILACLGLFITVFGMMYSSEVEAEYDNQE